MGKHENVDSIYHSQSSASVRKHLIRDNLNFWVMFHQEDMNHEHKYDDHVNGDINFARFREIRSESWSENHNY